MPRIVKKAEPRLETSTLLVTVWGLVVHSPYAQQIAGGTKRIEYRSWRTRYRGWLAIAAARRRDSGDDAGRVVGLVRLVDCTGIKGDFHWHLADPIQLGQRWEVPGQLGLFDVTNQVPASVAKLIGLAVVPKAATVRRRFKAAMAAKKPNPASQPEADASIWVA